MTKLLVSPESALEIIRAQKPKTRFAQSGEGDIWQYLAETDQWQCIAMTCVDYGAIKGPLPPVNAGTKDLPHCFVGVEKGDHAMTVDAKAEWGWDRVYRPNMTIYEPIEV